VVVPESPLAIKLSVGIKISSALRTISHFTANIGPRFSEEILPKLAIDPAILHVEREVGSAVCIRDQKGELVDQDVAKHFTAVLRQPFMPQEDEVVILVAALGESGYANVPVGIPVVQHLLDLDTEEKRAAFFDEYVNRSMTEQITIMTYVYRSYTRTLVDAVIPPMLHNGLAFEAHPQNMLVRISKSKRRVIGFVMRDLGGIRVHPETLRASTGVPFEFLPEHVVVTETLQEASKKLYHTLIHNHVQRLARVLGVHYSGVGWASLRRNLEARIPRESWLWDAWMADDAKSVSGKCLVRMKLADLYRDVRNFPIFLDMALVLT
jgi:siderophore synthetase component